MPVPYGRAPLIEPFQKERGEEKTGKNPSVKKKNLDIWNFIHLADETLPNKTLSPIIKALPPDARDFFFLPVSSHALFSKSSEM